MSRDWILLSYPASAAMFLAVAVCTSNLNLIVDAALMIIACVGTLSYLGLYFVLAQNDRRDKRMLEEFPELSEILEKEWRQHETAEDGLKSISDLRLAMTKSKQMEFIAGMLFLFSAIWILIGFIVAP